MNKNELDGDETLEQWAARRDKAFADQQATKPKYTGDSKDAQTQEEMADVRDRTLGSPYQAGKNHWAGFGDIREDQPAFTPPTPVAKPAMPEKPQTLNQWAAQRDKDLQRPQSRYTGNDPQTLDEVAAKRDADMSASGVIRPTSTNDKWAGFDPDIPNKKK